MPAKKKKSPLTALLDRLPWYVRNRYFLALVAFSFWMIFADRHDVMTQFRLNSTVNRLEDESEEYDRLIDRAETEKLDMERDRERFARESYFMQKDDEDVFIIVEE